MNNNTVVEKFWGCATSCERAATRLTSTSTS